MSPAAARVLVCVPTFKRPETLARLLCALGRQTVLGDPQVAMKVAVLDNDPAQSAREVAQNFAGLPAAYFSIPEPGLAAVRNAAIRLAERDADFLAFVDDDEEPCERWIAAFLEARGKTSCSILCGLRTPQFPAGAPDWIVRGGFFRDPLDADLARMKYAHSANTFLDCGLFARHRLRFDPAFSFTGGEDTAYFAQLRVAGEVIRHVRGAEVRDLIPAHRLTSRFLFTRAFRHGGTLLAADALSLGWRRALPLHLAKVLLRVACAPCVGLLSPWSKAAWLQSGLQLAKSVGTIAALFGFQVRPYSYGRVKPSTVSGKPA